MEIKFVWRGRVFSITIGYETPFHSSSHFIDIIEEFYEDRMLQYLDMKKSFFKRKMTQKKI
jgi:hypothetical protein